MTEVLACRFDSSLPHRIEYAYLFWLVRFKDLINSSVTS